MKQHLSVPEDTFVVHREVCGEERREWSDGSQD